MAKERTLIIIKPDAVQRHLSGEIISRLERKGLKFVAGKFTQIPKQSSGKLYARHKGKPFYEGLINFLSSSPIFIMVAEAEGAIKIVRKMAGSTFACEAEPGTIRGDLGCSGNYNLIHSSDSPESARTEIDLFFKPQELIDYHFADDKWLYGKNE